MNEETLTPEELEKKRREEAGEGEANPDHAASEAGTDEVAA
jgi:hypothetical protein